MEEMGDWGKVLEVIDLETSEASGAAESSAEGEVIVSDDSRLFLANEAWDGTKFLRSGGELLAWLSASGTLVCVWNASGG